jgi:uncharacterized protein
MTPQERDLITTLLGRLKGAAAQQKDPEADGLIRQAMADQPDAPYYLVQTVLIQDLSLHNAQNRMAELERQVAEAQQQAARPTSFLGGLFGARQPAPLPAPSVPSAGPWTRAPQVAAAPMAQPYQQPGYGQQQPGYGQPPGAGGFMGGGPMGGGFMGGGGGFLRSAAATAAGIAGGALLFQGIESLFGRGGGGILGGQATPGLGESVVNNYYGDGGSQDSGGGGQDFSSGDAGGSQDYGGGGQDFSSGDTGGDQDYGGGQDFSSDQDFGGGGDQDFGGGGDQDFGGGGDNFSC